METSTETTERCPKDGRDDVTKGFMLSAYFCISLQPHTLKSPSQKHSHLNRFLPPINMNYVWLMEDIGKQNAREKT